jgi:hypothetical protein
VCFSEEEGKRGIAVQVSSRSGASFVGWGFLRFGIEAPLARES